MYKMAVWDIDGNLIGKNAEITKRTIETLKKIITNLQSMPDVLSVRRLQQKNDLTSQRMPKKNHKYKQKQQKSDNSDK